MMSLSKTATIKHAINVRKHAINAINAQINTIDIFLSGLTFIILFKNNL